jgi:hypothetical protein
LADEANAQGNERRRRSYQRMADWARGKTFSWKTEAPSDRATAGRRIMGTPVHIEARREFGMAVRAAHAEVEESAAEHAATQGDDELRRFHQEAANWMRAYRFDWEIEAAGGEPR